VFYTSIFITVLDLYKTKKQFFSPLNSFIEVKNYFYKVIGKEDIQEIKIYKEDRSVVIDKIDFGINRPVSMES